jgi:phage portal protein BeeE
MNKLKIAFLTPVAKKTEQELNRWLPESFELNVAKTNEKREHIELLADADYVFLGGTHFRF